MNFAKTLSGIATGAIVSTLVGFAAAAAGLATFALAPAAILGAVVGLVLAVLNSQEPQNAAVNTFIGGGIGFVGYMLTTAAAMTIPGVALAIGTGLVVGWIVSTVSDSIGG